MISEVKTVHCLILRDPRRPLHIARECRVCRREGRLGHLAELVEDVWDLGLIGLVVHEDDSAGVGEDELREGGPVGEGHRYLGGTVDVFQHPGGVEGGLVECRGDVVGVHDEQRYHVVGICVEPFADGSEQGLVRSRVEVVTTCVAAVDGVVDVVGFTLDW